jgi:hypothetical protein
MDSKDEAFLNQWDPTRRSIGPRSTREEVKKAYLEAEARYHTSLQQIAAVFLIAEGYSERQIQRNADELIQRHASQIREEMGNSDGLIYRLHRLITTERDELRARAEL